MPRIMHETKNYTRQDDAVFVKINKKAPHKYLYLYLLFIFIYACLYAVKLKNIHQGVMVRLEVMLKFSFLVDYIL